MLLVTTSFVCLFSFCYGATLWSQGVVHYSIDPKDYDAHSQDVITSALTRIEREVCVKFFSIPANYSVGDGSRTLLISNPEKIKDCLNYEFDYSKSVVLMPIGYKCLNEKDIIRTVVDMIRASIKQSDAIINSFDLLKKFKEMNKEASPSSIPSVLFQNDRDFINAHYREECDKLASKPNLHYAMRSGQNGLGSEDTTSGFTEDNEKFYKDKQWPLGIVMYDLSMVLLDPQFVFGHKRIPMEDIEALKAAISHIESQTCIVFYEKPILNPDRSIQPKNYIQFTQDSDDQPFGFQEGVQRMNITSFIHGSPGHTSHILNNLMRILGVPMMSNRPDRDNYVTINWNSIEKGKEHLLEKDPPGAWLRDIPYDFRSVTHAPANYLCDDTCQLGAQTVQPLQDHLWQRTMSMGHANQLSDTDITMIRRLYEKECTKRLL